MTALARRLANEQRRPGGSNEQQTCVRAHAPQWLLRAQQSECDARVGQRAMKIQVGP